MPKLIPLGDAIKKSLNQILRNDLLGFFVKGQLALTVLAAASFLPIMIGIFSMMGKLMEYSESIEGAGSAAPPMGMPTPGPFALVMFIVGFITVVIYLFININLTIYLSLNISEEKTESIRTLLSLAVHNAPKLFLHMVIKGFILLLGFMLFIVPGIIFSIKYMFSEFVLLDENLGPVAALKRSSFLTKGYKWSLYLKAAGIMFIQLSLFVPMILFMALAGNKSLGPLIGMLYNLIMLMLLVYFYKDLKRIKSTETVTTPVPQIL
jgi:hypothetical protein